MKLALLNTSIVTADGVYVHETLSHEQAKKLIHGVTQDNVSEITNNLFININRLIEIKGIDSAIGHHSTAEIMSILLGIDVPVNRQTFTQERGQVALVFKLNGRPPEGKILSLEEIQEIGYTFKLLVRVS